jgi:hypothetical protein
MEPQGEKFVDAERVLELNKIRAFYMPILLHFNNNEETDDQSSLILKIDGTKIQLGRLEEGNDRDNLLRAIEVLVREKIIEDNKHVENWEYYPAFGAGCCMPMFNEMREKVIKNIKQIK